MKQFKGFPEGRLSYTPVPDLFFSDLLADIDDLAELKFTIYMFWALYHQEGSPRYVVMSELETDGLLISSLPEQDGGTKLEILHNAVNAAVARGTVLRLDISSAETTMSYLFLNTSQGRNAVREVKEGKLVLETVGRISEPHIQTSRPTIFSLYEDNIGLLSPLISEQLRDASTTYPESWISEAFRIAVERNVRNWRYIEAILKRWSIEGKS
ncbi:MAG: DnaD domain-containing protein [Anaerolineae bacterium]